MCEWRVHSANGGAVKQFADVNQDRVLRFATFGILDGFMGHNWYGILDKFVARFVDDGPIAVATKVRVHPP